MRAEGEVRRRIFGVCFSVLAVPGCRGAAGPAGEDGADAAMSVMDEPPGSNCANGGVLLSVGVDDDGDGTLDAEEVDQTAYICDGDTPEAPSILEGDVVIRNSLDLVLLQGVEAITGSLSVEAPGLTSMALPSLALIGGGLVVSHNPDLLTISLPALTAVSNVYIGYNDALTTIDMAAVSAIGDDLDQEVELYVGACPALSSVDLGSLQGHGALEILIGADPALVALDIGALKSAGVLQVNATGLEHLEAPLLEDLGELRVRNNNSLVGIDLPTLGQLTTGEITDNPSLCQSEVDALYADLGSCACTSAGNNPEC